MPFLFLALLACGEKDTDTATAETPTFTEVQQTLNQSCGFSSCHGSGTGDLTLDGGDGDYDALVDAPSAEAAGRVLVVAGSADQSYLIQKMEGNAGIEGDPMPPSGALNQDIIDGIRAWIDEGALDN